MPTLFTKPKRVLSAPLELRCRKAETGIRAKDEVAKSSLSSLERMLLDFERDVGAQTSLPKTQAFFREAEGEAAGPHDAAEAEALPSSQPRCELQPQKALGDPRSLRVCSRGKRPLGLRDICRDWCPKGGNSHPLFERRAG